MNIRVFRSLFCCGLMKNMLRTFVLHVIVIIDAVPRAKICCKEAIKRVEYNF